MYKEKKLRGGVNAGRLGDRIVPGRDFNSSTKLGIDDVVREVRENRETTHWQLGEKSSSR